MGTALFAEYLHRMEEELSATPGDYMNFDPLLASTTMLADIFREAMPTGGTLPEWCVAISTDGYKDAFWNTKRATLKRLLSPTAYVAHFPPAAGEWTLQDDLYHVGVDPFQRKPTAARLHGSWISQRDGGSNIIALRVARVRESMARGGIEFNPMPSPVEATPQPRTTPERKPPKGIRGALVRLLSW